MGVAPGRATTPFLITECTLREQAVVLFEQNSIHAYYKTDLWLLRQNLVHMPEREWMKKVKEKLDSLTPQMAEERYNYLSGKPISELTDAEYEERLALAERLSERANKK